MRQEEYLQILTEQIRSKKARGAVSEEIRGHIEEQKAEFMSEGMERREAEEAAVREMGDPVAAGNELDRIHRPKMAWGMIALIGILSAAGLLVQYLLKLQMEDSTILVRGLGHNVFYMFIGLGLMMAVCHLDYSRVGYWARELTALLAIVMILNMWLFGMQYNGKYYFKIPILGTAISYTYLFFLFVPLYAGVLYSFREQKLGAVVKGLALMFAILTAAAVISGITTAVILLPTFLVTLSIAVYKDWFRISRKKTLAVLWTGAALLPFIFYFGVMQFGAEYQSMRLRTWMSLDPSAGGYQISMVRTLLSESKFFGAAENTSKVVLPASGDFVISYVAAYYGVMAAILLAGLIAFLFFRLLRISLRQKNQLGMLMGASSSVVFLIQLVLYIFVNTGLFPDSAIYCPFVTGGASGMIVTYCMLGLILSIYRYQNVIPQKSTAEGKRMWV